MTRKKSTFSKVKRMLYGPDAVERKQINEQVKKRRVKRVKKKAVTRKTNQKSP